MYNWENSLPSAPEQLLNRCQQVLLTDDDIEKKHGTTIWAVKHWAQKNCKSFIWMNDGVDGGELGWDYIYAFYFHEEKDANWFQLRWK